MSKKSVDYNYMLDNTKLAQIRVAEWEEDSYINVDDLVTLTVGQALELAKVVLDIFEDYPWPTPDKASE